MALAVLNIADWQLRIADWRQRRSCLTQSAWSINNWQLEIRQSAIS